MDHLKMEMEMQIPISSNVKLITECSDTTYTCYAVTKDLIKVSKLPQTLISYSSSQKYLADTNLHVHLKEIKVDKTLRFVEEPVEIINREVKSLKRSRIPIVKSIGTRSEDEISLRRGYCDNCALSRENILKSIDEGPFQMGKFREILDEGALHLGPERDRVFVDLTPEEKDRFVPAVKLNKGLKTSNYDQLYAYLKQHEAHVNENKMMLERYSQHAIDPLALVSNVSPQQYPTQSSAIPQSAYVPPVSYQPQFADNTQLDSEYFKEKMLLMQAQENGVVLDEEQLLFIAGGQDNAFDTYVDEPLTMFIAILSVADPIYDEAGLSYDSNILSEVQDHDNCQDIVGEYHEVNEMQKDVQPNYVVASDTE
ncbi:hypothetical protein Tco_1036175 [Tanacetum coccineum]